MKVCDVCNEIVPAGQGCTRSDCPNQIQATTDPAPKVDPGFTGKADRFVQAGLDGAGGVARDATRSAFFVLAAVFAAILVVTIFALKDGDQSQDLNEKHSGQLPRASFEEAEHNNSDKSEESLSPQTDLSGMTCDDLWYSRNTIYADKGQCFKTERAINTFGARCHPPYGELSQSEQVRVSEIKHWEQQKGC